VRLPSERMPKEIKPLIDAVNQAFDRLERGFRAQRDLTADVAHELRTPLALLRMRAEAVDAPALKAQILSDIDVMTRTVSQLLAMAELENMVVDPSDRADLRRVCLEVIEHLAPLSVQADKQIELAGARDPVWVWGRQDFLFQAVRNLVENAVAHTRPGTRVTVELDEDGCVRVLDRGPGIPAESRDRLFERFWRRRRERSAVGAGAGLGLSIVAKIADSHAGAVTAGNRTGGGAVFTLSLRRAP
jgi:signal transduction histidine kinase